MKTETIYSFFAQDWRNFPRRAYIPHPNFVSLYMRDTKRQFVNKDYRTIDIASLEAKYKGRGSFANLIDELRESFPDRAIYIESVMNTRFADHLESVGFIPCSGGTIPPSYYLLPEDKTT